MGGLIKLFIAALLIAAIAYVGFCVPFGPKTLYGHMVAVFQTREAKKLGNEVEKKYQHTKRKIGRDIDHTITGIGKKTEAAAGALSETAAEKKQEISESLEKSQPAEHSREDRDALKKLFKAKIGQNAADTRD